MLNIKFIRSVLPAIMMLLSSQLLAEGWDLNNYLSTTSGATADKPEQSFYGTQDSEGPKSNETLVTSDSDRENILEPSPSELPGRKSWQQLRR